MRSSEASGRLMNTRGAPGRRNSATTYTQTLRGNLGVLGQLDGERDV